MKSLTCSLGPSYENEMLFRYKFNMSSNTYKIKSKPEIKHYYGVFAGGALDIANTGNYISPY